MAEKKLNKSTVELICRLESIIGNQCYNPNSYDGYRMEYGKYFRYPVHYEDKEGVEYKCWGRIEDLDKKKVDSLYYGFGSNELQIGKALVKVLDYLEQEYDLDFNELTKKKK